MANYSGPVSRKTPSPRTKMSTAGSRSTWELVNISSIRRSLSQALLLFLSAKDREIISSQARRCFAAVRYKSKLEIQDYHRLYELCANIGCKLWLLVLGPRIDMDWCWVEEQTTCYFAMRETENIILEEEEEERTRQELMLFASLSGVPLKNVVEENWVSRILRLSVYRYSTLWAGVQGMGTVTVMEHSSGRLRSNA